MSIYRRTPGTSMREAMRQANIDEGKHTRVTFGALQRALHPPSEPPAPAGRRTLIDATNELKLKEAILFYQGRGFNITKEHLREAVGGIIADLPEAERAKWKHDRPSEAWARAFCERHNLRFMAENRVDAARARATTKENYGKHFSVLSHLVKTHKITPERLSNWDESGYSFEKMTAGKAKVIVCKELGRAVTRGVNVGSDAEHITLGASITASGHAYPPIFVLPGTQAKYRVLEGGRVQTPDDYLPRGSLVYYRTPAGVDSDIMVDWTRSYLKETEELRRTGATMIIFDGYASHLSLRVLGMLRDGGVVVYALPSHSSHFTQPLDVTVFGPLKERAKQRVSTYVNNPANAKSKFTVYTACEFLSVAYNQAMTPGNIKAGFEKTGIHPLNPDVFTDKTFGVSAVYAEKDTSEPWADVHKRFFKDGASLANSAPVTKTGTLDTTAGAHVTNAAVSAVLQRRYQEKKEKEAASVALASERVRKRGERDDQRFTASINAAIKAGDRAVAEAVRVLAAADRQAEREAARLARLEGTPVQLAIRRRQRQRAARPLAVRRRIARERRASR